MGVARGDLLLFVAALSGFGLVTGLYLAAGWYAGETAAWCDVDAYFNCSKVRESPWSSLGGVPTALIGAAGFAVLLGLSVLALAGRQALGPWPVESWLLVFAAVGAVIGFGLTLVEVFLIQAICILCAAGFGADLAILGLAFLLRSPRQDLPAEGTIS